MAIQYLACYQLGSRTRETIGLHHLVSRSLTVMLLMSFMKLNMKLQPTPPVMT